MDGYESKLKQDVPCVYLEQISTLKRENERVLLDYDVMASMRGDVMDPNSQFGYPNNIYVSSTLVARCWWLV